MYNQKSNYSNNRGPRDGSSSDSRGRRDYSNNGDRSSNSSGNRDYSNNGNRGSYGGNRGSYGGDRGSYGGDRGGNRDYGNRTVSNVAPSLTVSDELFALLKEVIIEVLLNDPRTMPLNILKIKTFQEAKVKTPNLFINEPDFLHVVQKLEAECLIGQTQYNRFFVDYLDYERSDKEGQGYLQIEPKRGNGFITIKKEENEYKKSSHFVHKKNLNNAKDGDYVKFVELIVNNPKHFSKFALIDAAITEVLENPKK